MSVPEDESQGAQRRWGPPAEQWAPIGSQPAWIDPNKDVEQATWTQRKKLPASWRARALSVVVDFLLLKAASTTFFMAFAGMSILIEAAGQDTGSAGINLAIILTANGLLALLLFVVYPIRTHGVTIGRRIAGFGPRTKDGRGSPPWRQVGRHDLIAFVLPSLLLDPGDVFGTRDQLVLTGWLALQSLRTSLGQTPLERAFGLWMISDRDDRQTG
jgi:hypothetical protein